MLKEIALALLAGLSMPGAVQDDWAAIRKEWNKPVAPFRIIGNVHYVGTAGIAAYLITDPKGHILIDGGMEESAPLIADNIAALGFKLRDVKILLINHAHWDHSGGLAELKRRSGARLLASAADKPGLEAGLLDYRPDISHAPAVKVDGVLAEGTPIRLGTTTLIARMTPGHTKGCTSWTMRTGGRELLFACSLTVAGQPLTQGKGYDAAARDFRATYAKLRGMQVDVFLAFHGGAFDLDAKRARLLAGDADAFVDPGELKRRVDAAENGFEKELKGG